jgi:Fur family ferric uptake transcriptional regulator
MGSEAIEERLRSVGLRATAPRIAVLQVLAQSHDHPRVDQIIARVRASGLDISTQAVYDTCEAFERAELARRIAIGGGPTRYEARVGDNHHHLVCRSCSRAVDVDCVVGTAPCLELPDDHGFALDQAEVTFWGMCPDCQAKKDEGIA